MFALVVSPCFRCVVLKFKSEFKTDLIGAGPH